MRAVSLDVLARSGRSVPQLMDEVRCGWEIMRDCGLMITIENLLAETRSQTEGGDETLRAQRFGATHAGQTVFRRSHQSSRSSYRADQRAHEKEQQPQDGIHSGGL